MSLTALKNKAAAAEESSQEHEKLVKEYRALADAHSRDVELCKAENAMGIPVVVPIVAAEPAKEEARSMSEVADEQAQASFPAQGVEAVDVGGQLPPEWDMGYMDAPDAEPNRERELELSGLKPAQDQAKPMPTMGDGSLERAASCGRCCGPLEMPFGF